MSREECPSCGSKMQGEPIPEENREWYGGKTHFSRCMGYQERGVYDGVLIWMCPDCGHAWPRFPESDRLHDKALEIIEKWRTA